VDLRHACNKANNLSASLKNQLIVLFHSFRDLIPRLSGNFIQGDRYGGGKSVLGGINGETFGTSAWRGANGKKERGRKIFLGDVFCGFGRVHSSPLRQLSPQKAMRRTPRPLAITDHARYPCVFS
jgi:hypothetical protein